MPGTALGLTKETIWMRSSPVCDKASISAILRAVEIGPFSIWKPSRGPSSVMYTDFGRSLIMLGSRLRLHGHDPTTGQRCNLGRTKPELSEDHRSVLADGRRLPAQREIVVADLDRQPR